MQRDETQAAPESLEGQNIERQCNDPYQSQQNGCPDETSDYLEEGSNHLYGVLKCPKFSISGRCGIAAVTSFSLFICYGMRWNFPCRFNRILKGIEDIPELEWDQQALQNVNRSFYWGYWIGILPAAVIATIYSDKRILGIPLTLLSILNLLVPVAMEISYATVLVVRFLQGMTECFIVPASYSVLRLWGPPKERTRLASVVLCGIPAGNAAGLVLSSLLMEKCHWSLAFYLYGGLGFACAIFWSCLTRNMRSEHAAVTVEELHYIHSVDYAVTVRMIPWKSMFSSPPIYAIIAAQASFAWVTQVTTTPLSKFQHMPNLAFYGIPEVQTVSYLMMACCLLCSGLLADWIHKKKLLKLSITRKVFGSTGTVLQVAFLIGSWHVTEPSTFTLLLILACGFGGVTIIGFQVNALDIAPRYASLVIGIAMLIESITSAACDYSLHNVTLNRGVEEMYFGLFLAFIFHSVSGTVYAIFGSGKPQQWGSLSLKGESLSSVLIPTEAHREDKSRENEFTQNFVEESSVT